MTDTSASTPADTSPQPADDETTRWKQAKQIRQQHPRWVIIWVPDKLSFHAWPLFRAPRGTCLTAREPGEMTAQMEQIEQARFRRATLPRAPA